MKLTDTKAIDELTGKDAEFRKELIETCIGLFQAFPAEFADALSSGQPDQVRFAVHKVKANVLLVEASLVNSLLHDTQTRVLAGTLTESDAKAVLEKIRLLFGKMAEELALAVRA